uniref:Uncharacterized protein n=1 Tax=Syphacia muris TaxID=451379 RepID=A0A0N5AR48_9BILA
MLKRNNENIWIIFMQHHLCPLSSFKSIIVISLRQQLCLLKSSHAIGDADAAVAAVGGGGVTESGLSA